jgi:hypothetical protein
MQRSVFIFAILVALMGFGCNEQISENDAQGLRDTPTKTPAAEAAPEEHSMTGCLQQGEAPEEFVLTDDTGLRIAQIRDATPNLAPHVGHRVEITGSSIPNAQTYAMKVTAVEMIAPSCP